MRCPLCSTHTPRSPYTAASPRPFSGAMQRGGSGAGAADAAAADAYRQETYFAELLGYRCTGRRTNPLQWTHKRNVLLHPWAGHGANVGMQRKP